MLGWCALIGGIVWIGNEMLKGHANRVLIEELGGSIVTLSSSVGSANVLSDATEIEFERPIGDEELAKLAYAAGNGAAKSPA